MSGSASILIAQPPLPWRRCAWALVASLLLHLLVADFGFGGRGQPASPALSLHAELAVMPAQSGSDAAPAATAVPLSAAPRVSTPTPAQSGQRDSAASDVAPTTAGISDQQIYQARELDRYPQPLAPLSLNRAAGSGPLRLWLTIDTRGHVVELAAASPGRPVEAALRGQLLAVVFSPALRGQQAVKSRILLELDD